MSESNRKSLLWLQNHHIQFKCKPHVFFNPLYVHIFMFILWDMKGKHLNNNGNWVLLHMTFYESIRLSVYCMMNEHKLVHICVL